MPRPSMLPRKLCCRAGDKSSGSPTGVVLRLATVYGPRMKGNYPKLIRAMARGYFIPVGSGTNRRTLVYEEDAVRAALLAAHSPRAQGRIYNLTDGEVYSLRDILSAICSALGRPTPLWFLPAKPIRCFAVAADTLSSLARHPLHWANTLDKLIEDVAVCADRIHAELGFQPLVNLQEGWEKTLAARASALLNVVGREGTRTVGPLH
jgi:UDP-glucose 4-epimerase